MKIKFFIRFNLITFISYIDSVNTVFFRYNTFYSGVGGSLRYNEWMPPYHYYLQTNNITKGDSDETNCHNWLD